MSQRFVLFADMLGYANLVLDNPNSVHSLDPRLGAPSKQEKEAIAAGDQLIPRFRGFHKAVSSQINDHLRRDSKAIIFSDSVFVTLYKLPDIMGFARGLMWKFLSNRIPARMAIAAGSFSTLRYASDIAGDAAIYSTQFLGTGVVKAYQAERMVKGIAIALDESVMPFVGELQPGEVFMLPAPQEKVSAIGNFIFHGTDDTPDHREKRVKDARSALSAMRKKADRKFHHYYDFAVNNLEPLRDS
jgi:hypothetical protein